MQRIRKTNKDFPAMPKNQNTQLAKFYDDAKLIMSYLIITDKIIKILFKY